MDSAETGPVLLEREKYDDGQKFMFDTQMFQGAKKFASAGEFTRLTKLGVRRRLSALWITRMYFCLCFLSAL